MLSKFLKKKDCRCKNLKKDYELPKRIVLFFLIFFCLAQISVFAQQITGVDPSKDFGNSGINTVLNNIVGFFGSVWMKAICLIALGAIALTMLTHRGEPGLFKKFIPWIIAIGLLLSLPTIIDLFWKGTDSGKMIVK